jgi:hypothetical protein
MTKWIEALESGTYTQAHGALCKELVSAPLPGEAPALGFCCMGVLCEVAGKTRLQHDVDSTLYGYHHFTVDPNPGLSGKVQTGYPPPNLLIEAGLKREDQYLLAAWNDSDDKTFTEIAELLRNIIKEREASK